MKKVKRTREEIIKSMFNNCFSKYTMKKDLIDCKCKMFQKGG